MRRVNVPLIIGIALLLFGGVAATYLLHRFQVRRNAEDMARQAKRQIDEGHDHRAHRAHEEDGASPSGLTMPRGSASMPKSSSGRSIRARPAPAPSARRSRPSK